MLKGTHIGSIVFLGVIPLKFENYGKNDQEAFLDKDETLLWLVLQCMLTSELALAY